MNVRPARPDELDLVVNWRDERAAWLGRQGRDQWGSGGLGRASFIARVKASISAGETWILEKSGQPAATIAIDQWSDPGLWSDAEMADALFLHRLISPLDSGGFDVAGPLVSHALLLAAQQHKRWLRLDAWTSNTKLHTFWVRQGFEKVRTVPGPKSGTLFQRPVFDGTCGDGR